MVAGFWLPRVRIYQNYEITHSPSFSGSDFGRCSARDLRSIENRIRPQMRRPCCQQLLFAINQIRGVEGCQLKPVTVCDSVGRTRFHAVSAKNAAVVVDVVDLSIALSATYAVLGRVFCRLNIDTICRAVGRAKKTGHTLL